jgi:hypothetical protein
MSSSDLTVGGNLILHKDQSTGIKLDATAPTYGWADIIGQIRPDDNGGNQPSLATFRGGLVREYAYSANDKIDMLYHINHDYAPGTDIFIHLHWGHNGTAISGSFVASFAFTYAKGHNQANFPAETTATLTVSTPDIATIPQYRHRVDEIQISSATPNANQFDSSLIEPDGILLVNMTVTTIPTITGGSPNEPFIFTSDLHYQTTGIKGTKSRSPSFWT